MKFIYLFIYLFIVQGYGYVIIMFFYLFFIK